MNLRVKMEENMPCVWLVLVFLVFLVSELVATHCEIIITINVVKEEEKTHLINQLKLVPSTYCMPMLFRSIIFLSILTTTRKG